MFFTNKMHLVLLPLISHFLTHQVHPDDECNALSISIDSVEGSIPPLASKHGEESYESVADNLPSLSYRVQGSIDRRAQVSQ